MLMFYRSIIPSLWLIWLAYWIISAVGNKPVARRESPRSRFIYIAPMIAGGILLSSPAAGGAVLHQRFLPFSFAAFWIAVALVAGGLAFACAARAWLGGNWSGTVTLKENHELVRSGPYRFVRHPIYTGLLLAIAGSALAIGEWRGLVALALFLVSSLYKLRLEENFMLEQFGDAYRRYRKEVPALLPLWRKTDRH